MNSVEQYIEKSDEAILDAEILLTNQRYNSTASRAYYAAFHAVQAVLFTKQITAKTHQGVLSKFNNEFIRNDIFPKEFGKYLKKTLDKRLLGDYEIGFKFDEQDAIDSIEQAKEVINGIKQYLIENQFIATD